MAKEENVSFDLAGRRALVTGASRGIGRSIALVLAQYGADVAVHYASRAADALQVVDEVKSLGRNACAVGGDLGELATPAKLYAEAVRQLGQIDILVLNASIQINEAWQKITAEQFDQQINVNLRASLLLMQLAIGPMQERKWGRVLAIGSVQQIKPAPQMCVYAASKCAQMSLVRNIARQVASDGVTVNNLSPGVVDTERNAHVMADAQNRAHVMKRIPVGFVGQPQDCAGAALLLCSDAGRYITGADVLVDGGWSF